MLMLSLFFAAVVAVAGVVVAVVVDVDVVAQSFVKVGRDG